MDLKHPRSLDEAMRLALADGASQRGMPLASAPSDLRDPIDVAMQPPADPSGYVFTPPKGVAWDRKLEDTARGWFHNAGLPQSVVTGILQQYCRHVCGGAPVKTGVDDREIAALRSEWGPDWESNLNHARSVVQSSKGGDALVEILDESGLGSDPWLIRTLAAVGRSREDAQD